jgi:cytochrome c
MKPATLIASLFLLTLAAATAHAQDQDPVVRGRGLAVRFCAPCHSIGTRQHSPHRDAPPLRTIGRTYDLDQFARVLGAGLLAGHPDMPQFKFDYEDARALRDYLRTIQE